MKLWRELSLLLVAVGAGLLLMPSVRATNIGASGGSPGGSSGEVQYNNAGAFGGVSGITLTGGALTRGAFGGADAANSVDVNETAGCITFEGSTANTIEMRLCATNPAVGDQVINLPNLGAAQTHTLPTLEGQQTFSAPNTFSGALTATNANGARLSPLAFAVTTTATTQFGFSWAIYTNAGDTDGATITLENNPGLVGENWQFAVVEAQTLTIVPSSGESLYLGADQCNVSITSNVVGSYLKIAAVTSGSGGKFFSTAYSGTWVCND